MSKKRGVGLFARPSGFSLDAPSIPTEAKKRDEPIHTAYCPLAESLCSDVACETCSLIDNKFGDYLWVCSTCTEGLIVQPYYGNGTCELCGYESGVLMLGIPRE